MVLNMMANISTVKSMEKVVLLGLMVALIMEILRTTIFKVKVPIIGQMEECS